MKVKEKRAAKGEWWEEALSLVSGCTAVSEGCANCWAATMSHVRGKQSNEKIIARYGGVTTPRGKWNGQIKLMWDDIKKPLHVKRPTVWAVWNDLFHPDVPYAFINTTWAMIAQAYWHTFIILTKRPERIVNAFPPNVIIGTSAENQEWMDKRAPEILKVPGRKVLSLEPLLGPVDLGYPKSLFPKGPQMCCDGRECGCMGKPLDPPIIYYFNWVIVGCESGPNRRPCKIEWVESVVEQCVAANVPVWVKQIDIGGKVERDLSKFPKHLQRREMPE